MYTAKRSNIPILLVSLCLTAGAGVARAVDCNSNGVEDATDIAGATSVDCNTNGAPDDCELGCPCADIVFLRDVTGSKGNLDIITTQLADFTTNAVAQWGSDLRISLITFEDFVTVIHPLTPDHAAVISSMQALQVGDGQDLPEASDEALRAMLEGTSICTNGSSGVFDVPFRVHCTKHAILITDDVPGGCDDVFSIGLDDVNAHQRALDAASVGIKIQAVYTGEDITTVAAEIMRDYADVTGGMLYTKPDVPDLLAEQLTERVIQFICAGLGDCDNDQVLNECEVEPRLYVDTSVSGGLGDGSSWANAFLLLQDTLAAVTDCRATEIWVAAGTYYPDLGASQTADDRTETFNLINGVSIYGGFFGTETLLNQRDVDSNATILSGDIVAGNSDSYQVVTAASGTEPTAVLDGFTVTGGRADGTSGVLDVGAGLIVESGGAATIRLCTFDSNIAENGAGAYVGGGATFEDCTFLRNQADNSGGGLFVDNGTTQITGTFFGSNGADNRGAGMYAERGASGTVDRCTFVANNALGAGGGIFLTNSNTAFTISNTYFGTNGAAGDFDGGGGIAVWDGSDATIYNCVFSDNLADFGGGVSVYNGGGATIVNATFSRNIAQVEQGGGGLNNASSSAPSVVLNSIFRENEDLGGTPDQISQDTNPATLTVSHSNVQGGQGGIFSCVNCNLDYTASNIDAGPLFIDSNGPDNRFGTLDDNLRLDDGSPSIDTGSNGAVTAIAEDFDGNDRVINGTVDMGAFEIPVCADTDVNCDGSTTSVDLGIVQSPANWNKDCNSAGVPRADVNRSGTVTSVDLGIIQSPANWNTSTGAPCICVIDVCGSEELLMGDGGESSMMSLASESESEGSGGPWTFVQADVAIELRPAAGGSAVTVLEPHANYAVYYDAESDGVTGYILAAVAATADEGLDSATVAGTGAWLNTGRFVFVDIAESEGGLVTAPAHSGLYRTDWVTDTVLLPGESGDHAPSSGLLHTITTSDAGDLLLELSMYYRDEESGVWVDMVSTVAYDVEDESE